jgi:hypothetical protein
MRNSFRTLFLALGFVGTTVAFADPSAQIDVGTTGFSILSNTASSPKYRCTYTVAVAFQDGTTTNSSGQTDPPTGATNSRVVIMNLNKSVRSATLTQWNCRPIQ